MPRSIAAHQRYEKGLLSPARLWLSAQGFVPLTEFRVPWGICDLVGLHPDILRAEQRIALSQLQPIGGMEAFMVLESIPSSRTGRSVKSEEVIAAVNEYLTATKTEEIIDRLLRRKYLEKTNRGGLRKNLPWFPYHTQLIAIELKLLRVDEALKQAINHKAITRLSYAAFPEELAAKVSASAKREDFEAAGVGILATNAVTCYEILKPSAKGHEQLSLYGAAAAERCWSAVLETVHH